jgi:hypothetical protein
MEVTPSGFFNNEPAGQVVDSLNGIIHVKNMKSAERPGMIYAIAKDGDADADGGFTMRVLVYADMERLSPETKALVRRDLGMDKGKRPVFYTNVFPDEG